MEAILADPAAYHGRPVRVNGFLILELEGSSLWLSEADFRAERHDRSVWINRPVGVPEDHPLSGKRAYVTGVVDAVGWGDGQGHGHLGSWPASLTDIVAITPDPTDTDRARPWMNDPLFDILASLGFLGLFFAVVVLSARARRMAP